MSRFPSTGFQYQSFNPSLTVDKDNLLQLNYPQDQQQQEAMIQQSLFKIQTPQSTIMNAMRNELKSEDDLNKDLTDQFEAFAQQQQIPYRYSSDILKEQIKNKAELVDRHSKFLQKQQGLEDDQLKTWEAYQAIQLEGNLNNSVLTVALGLGDVTQVDPEKASNSSLSYFWNVTAARGSLYGKIQDVNATAPQVSELIGTNAQTLFYMATRWRGGKKGKLWEEATENSSKLKEWFKEDPTTKQFLDYATNISPTLFSISASTDIGWAGKSIYDYLREADKPEDWNPKEAVELIKQNAPQLAYVLFDQMQLTEEQLTSEEVAYNPQMFKYFIADAIDGYATAIISKTYNDNSNAFSRVTFDLVAPIFRDSLNSNDTVAEISLTALGFGLTALGGAAAGPTVGLSLGASAAGVAATTTGLASLTARVTRTTRAVARTAAFLDSYNAARYINRVGLATKKLGKTSNIGLKTIARISSVAGHVNKFAPHNLGESLLQLTKKTKVGKYLYVAKETPFDQLYKSGWKTLAETGLKYSARSIINGSIQGAAEDGIRQWQVLSAGFDNSFSWSALGQNMVEEGIGEILLGGALNVGSNWTNATRAVTQRELKALDMFDVKLTQKLGNFGKQKAVAVFNNLPKDIRRRLETSVGVLSGLNAETLEGMTLEQRVDFRVAAIDLAYRLDDFGTSTGLGNFMFQRGSNQFVEDILTSMADGNESQVSSDMRRNLTKSLLGMHERTKDPKTGNSTINPDEWKTLTYLAARDSIMSNDSIKEEDKDVLLKRLNAVLFRNTAKEMFAPSTQPNGVEQSFDLTNTTLEQQEEFAQKLKEREDAVKVKVFGSMSDEERKAAMEGTFISEEDQKFLSDLATKFKEQTNTPATRLKGVGLGVSGISIKPTVETKPESSIKTKDEDTDNEGSLTDADQEEEYLFKTLEQNPRTGFVFDQVQKALKTNQSGKDFFGSGMDFEFEVMSEGLKAFTDSETNQIIWIIDEARKLGLDPDTLTAKAFFILAKQARAKFKSAPTVTPEATPKATPEVTPGAPEATPEVTPGAPEATPKVTPSATPVTPEATPETPKISESISSVSTTTEISALALSERLKVESDTVASIDIKPEDLSDMEAFLRDSCS